MRKKSLIKFLKRDGRYLFSIGRYLIPTYYKTRKGCTINLNSNRKKALIENTSTWSKYFDIIMKRAYPNYRVHKEVPLIIEDISKWNNCCNKYGVLDEEFRDRNYFLADYIFPEYNLIVEIDSNLHDYDYDKARDDYIKSTWGFKVLRFFEFGSDPDSMNKFLDQLDIKLANKPDETIKLGYSDLIIDSFTHNVGTTTLKIIKKVDKYINKGNVPRGRGVQLCCNKLLSFMEQYFLISCEQFMEVFQSYFKYTYNINVFVTPSNP
nr:MAG TPA: Very-short-patch-repair endonuclease [Caudoviricetes sp.]